MDINNVLINASGRKTRFFASNRAVFEILNKTPTEILQAEVEFKGAIPIESILNGSTSTVTAEDSSGVDATAALISGIEVVDSTTLRCKISAGTDDADYVIVFVGVLLPTAYRVEKRILLHVRAGCLI